MLVDSDGAPVSDAMLAAMARRRWGDDLAIMKARAMQEVDAAAEAARTRWITPGAGQAMEYLLTEAEARAYEAGAPGPFPLLEAERDARRGVPSLSGVAAEVVALGAAWRRAAAEIKRMRRAAKIAVEAAKSPAEVAKATAVQWPAP